MAAIIRVLALALVAASKPVVVRVRRPDGALRRVAFEGEDAPTLRDLREGADVEDEPLYLDEACTVACAGDASTLATYDIAHGSVVYCAPAELVEVDEVVKNCYSPFPGLAKHAETGRQRTHALRTRTWKELERERETVFYVKSFDRVCDLAELDEAAVSGFCADAADGDAAWLLGARGVDGRNATVSVEAAVVAGDDDAAVFAVAEGAGLEVVGVAFYREKNENGTFALTAREVAAAARAQRDAMEATGDDRRPYTFATIVASDGGGSLGSEAFEASPLAVQMAAEGVFAADQEAGPEAFVATTEAVVVERKDVEAVDPRFLYRAVPVGAREASAPLASAFAASGAAARWRAAASKAAKRAVIAAHLGGHAGRKKLTARVADVGLVLALKKDGLPAADYDAVVAACAAARDPAAAAPPKLGATVAAAIEARYAAAAAEE